MKKNIIKIMMILLTMVVLISCGNSTTAETSGKKKYVIATDTSFPPFEFKNENNEYVGIDIDLVKKIAELEGFEVEFKPMDFGGIIPALQSGQVDGAIAAASITEERKQTVDFSDPYYETGVAVVTLKTNTDINSVETLAGKKIAVKNGTEGARFAEENLNGKATITVFEDSISIFKAVENGQADAAFEDLPVAGYTIKMTPDSKLKLATGNLTSGFYGFMVKKGQNTELLEKINKGLKTLKENGEYDKIIESYVGK